MEQFLIQNWEYILVGFVILEKIVKLSPTKKDDILFDAIVKPIFNMIKGKVKK